MGIKINKNITVKMVRYNGQFSSLHTVHSELRTGTMVRLGLKMREKAANVQSYIERLQESLKNYC